jgi:hypothetical protein
MRVVAAIWIFLGLVLTWTSWKVVARPSGLPRKSAFWLVIAALLLMPLVSLSEGAMLDILGWSTSASVAGTGKAMLAAAAVLAPIEQAALVLIVWPTYRAHRLLTRRAALSAALLVGLAFSIADGGWLIATSGSLGMLARVLVRSTHMIGAAMIWVAAASYDQNHRKHWFPLAWLVAVIVQGFGNHVALGMAPGFCVVALPTLLVMVIAAVSELRDPKRVAAEALIHDEPSFQPEDVHPTHLQAGLRRLSRVSLLPERPTIHQIRVAWKHQHRPALLHWIAAGTVICIGSLLVFLAASVAVAHWLNMDLSRVDDGDITGTGPMLLMGVFVLASFPIAGYLVALASAADSVFEPGMGALIAIVLVIALLSMTAPVGVVLALALAPLAFGLACMGAWFGLVKS